MQHCQASRDSQANCESKACKSGSSIYHYSTRQKWQLDEVHNAVEPNSSYRISFSSVDL